MSGEPGWLLKEIERAKERSARVPAWARPIFTPNRPRKDERP